MNVGLIDVDMKNTGKRSRGKGNAVCYSLPTSRAQRLYFSP